MAQSVVRLPGSHEVVGSNPCWCITFLAENIPVLSGLLVLNIRILHRRLGSEKVGVWVTDISSINIPEEKLSPPKAEAVAFEEFWRMAATGGPPLLPLLFVTVEGPPFWKEEAGGSSQGSWNSNT